MRALLLSGGMDSISLAAMCRPEFGLTIDYGQVCAEAEMRAAEQVCKELGIHHIPIAVNCGSLGSGDLAGTPPDSIAPVPEWWPYRNQLLITIAAMKSIALGVKSIIIGTVRSDSCHVDGTQAFVDLIAEVIHIQEGEIVIEAPAISMTSAELVRLSNIPMALLSWAHSCHRSNFACGQCRGCNKHRQVMSEIGYESY